MADVVGIGCAVFDMMLIVDEFPVEDTKCSGLDSKIQCGGPCAVAMIAASKLGVQSKMIVKQGDDTYGKTIKERLGFYGVDTTDVTLVPDEKSSVCVVISNQSNSSRTCVGGGGGRGAGLVLKPEDIDLDAIKNAKYLHVDGMNYDAAVYAAKKAHEFGTKVSMDVDGYNPNMEELLTLVDEMIPSEKFAYRFAGTDDVEEAAMIVYNKFKPDVLIVTQGPKGGVVVQDGVLTHYKAFKVNAIDTNGAGDVFHGGYVAARIKGMDVLTAVRFASATSAIKCTHFGASEGAPHFDDVVKFLEEHQEA